MYATPDQTMTLLTHQVPKLTQALSLAALLPPLVLWGAPGDGTGEYRFH